MSQVTPPIGLWNEPPTGRVQRRLLQIALAAATIFATSWCYKIHVGLGLTATFLAKHILVAILAAALRLPIREIKP